MTFGPVALDQALGCILAHTHRLGSGSPIRKGTQLTEAHIEALREEGLTEVVAARLDPTDVGENAAAAQVAEAVAGDGIEVRKARTGRCNLHARHRGVLVVDERAIHRVNAVDTTITVGTLPPFARVESRDMVATVKLIAFAAPQGSVARASEEAAPHALRVAPFLPRRVALVTSDLPGHPERLIQATCDAQRQRVRALDGDIVLEQRVAHTSAGVATALRACRNASADLVLFMGASAIVDPADVLPSAVTAVGGRVVRLGMPVDPGNLALVAQWEGMTVLGVPGCARTPKRNGFDLLLERVFVGLAVTSEEVSRMGVGGLLAEAAGRTHPRADPPADAKLGAVVLAAGLSSRMGSAHKLLADLQGRPLVTWSVDALLHAGVRPVVVVVGHQGAEIHRALGDRPIHVVENARPAAGLASSIAAGVDALPGGLDGFFVMLGDVPFVRPEDVAALASAFHPDAGAAICVPVHAKRRGHPVLWADRFRSELAALQGDSGARSILEAHSDHVCLVPVDNPGIHVDVDTPQALQDARATALALDPGAD